MAPNDEFFELNVGNILGGKFPELFNKAIQQLIDNMRDVNTPADSTRKISFEFTFKPTDDRQTAAVLLSTKLKLASMEPCAGTVYVSKAEGTLKAYTRDIRQEILFDEKAATTKQ
jgi:hypothetical protein